ncbi:hypothetical protein LshimejAT787_0504260 [Lyophyllum shimeji]|uniref:Uncharacterized protein n=1 Tax=Lyophyllum shimeji TaxID=47721 RepID=A0A9P3UPS1_LYOSH|nr:hypothetical protein LshimejAT787_0504260 [Lyophyllum shimeji]
MARDIPHPNDGRVAVGTAHPLFFAKAANSESLIGFLSCSPSDFLSSYTWRVFFIRRQAAGDWEQEPRPTTDSAFLGAFCSLGGTLSRVLSFQLIQY